MNPPPVTDPVANSTPEPPITHDLAVGSSQETSAAPANLPSAMNGSSPPQIYGLGSSHETSAAPANLPSATNGSSPPQIYGNETATMLPDQTKVIKALRCEVCNIEVNSKNSYEQHIAGKKHKKNLQVQTNPTIASHADVQTETSSIQGQALIGPVAEQSEPKKQVDSVKVCSTCNVLCTSQDAYNKHIAGRKHNAKAALVSTNGICPSIAESERNGDAPFQKAAKKVKVDQSTWCEVCKISCNSREVYITHVVGQKHLKNLKKLSDPKIDVDTGATATATNTLIVSQEKPDSGALATATNTLIMSQEKPDSGATATASNTLIGPEEKPDSDKPKPKKKRKVVEGGAAFDGFKMCTLCTVLCNSQTVFDSHLIGHKHTAMVKKTGSITG